MYIVLLTFAANRDAASRFVEGHNAWLKRGFDDGVFLLSGTLQPRRGGGIVAHNATFGELQARVSEDPFVAENVVSAEIHELTPARADAKLQFLLPAATP